MIDITQIRTHGRLAKTLKLNDVIYAPSFHFPFARIVEVVPTGKRILRFIVESGGERSIRDFDPDARVDLVVSVPPVETPFGPAVDSDDREGWATVAERNAGTFLNPDPDAIERPEPYSDGEWDGVEGVRLNPDDL